MEKESRCQYHRWPGLIQTYKSPISDGSIRMCDVAAVHGDDECATENLRRVNAKSRDNNCLYYRQRLGPLGGIPCNDTERRD